MIQQLSFEPLTPAQYVATVETLAQMAAIMERLVAESDEANCLPELQEFMSAGGISDVRAWQRDGTARAEVLTALIDKHREAGTLDEYLTAVVNDPIAGREAVAVNQNFRRDLVTWERLRALAEGWGLPFPTGEGL